MKTRTLRVILDYFDEIMLRQADVIVVCQLDFEINITFDFESFCSCETSKHTENHRNM